MEKLKKTEIEAIERWKQLSENRRPTQCPFILVYNNKLSCRRCRKLIGASQHLVCPCVELGIDVVTELANKLLTFSKSEQVEESKHDSGEQNWPSS